MSSPIVDFYASAQDFLVLIAKKAKQGQVNSEAAKELQTMESFYEISHAIITRCQVSLNEERMLAAVEHIKGKLLEKEIREIYNELHKKNQSLLADILMNVKTVLPTKSELKEEIHIKNQNNG